LDDRGRLPPRGGGDWPLRERIRPCGEKCLLSQRRSSGGNPPVLPSPHVRGAEQLLLLKDRRAPNPARIHYRVLFLPLRSGARVVSGMRRRKAGAVRLHRVDPRFVLSGARRVVPEGEIAALRSAIEQGLSRVAERQALVAARVDGRPRVFERLFAG